MTFLLVSDLVELTTHSDQLRVKVQPCFKATEEASSMWEDA
jgi:hypothetical protein